MVECRLAASEASVRSRGRASHEDCCAAAREPTGVGHAGSELPAEDSELTELAGIGGQSGALQYQGSCATAERSTRVRPARKDTDGARKRERERREEGERERDRGREEQR